MNNIEIMCMENRTEFWILVGWSVVVVDKNGANLDLFPKAFATTVGRINESRRL